MSYFRGDHYVFDDGDRLCWWARAGYDAHREWGKHFGAEGSSGVQVPHALMDRFVMMRFAEMLVDGTAGALLDEMSADAASPGLEHGARRASVIDPWQT